jgi:uncharacterized DUF497 family protein
MEPRAMRVLRIEVSTSLIPRALFSIRIVLFRKTRDTATAKNAISFLAALIDGRIYVIVYRLRTDSMRIISARKANQREVKQYENRSHDN